MNMTDVYQTSDSYHSTIMNQFNNDTDIERSSISDEYINKELISYKTSTIHMIMYNNVLIDKYLDKIRRTCNVKVFSKEDNIKYRFRPEALSTDVYGFPGLWYLILKVNSCEDFNEFNNLPKVLVPDINVISECLTNEEFILTKPEL